MLLSVATGGIEPRSAAREHGPVYGAPALPTEPPGTPIEFIF